MKRFRLILCALYCAVLVSCDKTDKTISKESAESDIPAIIESIKSTDKDSIKTIRLKYLLMLSKDRDYYIESRKKSDAEKGKESDYDFTKYLVSEEKFKEQTDKFFKLMAEKKYTYKQFLKECDDENVIIEKYYKELEPEYKTIDSLCTTFQKMIDEGEKNVELMKDSLNKIVQLKLVSITQDEYDYRDVVAVRILMTNLTDKPIEALSFAVTFTDKLGNELCTLNCKSNDGFAKSDVGLWTYERFGNRSEIYDKLKNVSASHVTMKQKINKVNWNGTLIGSELDDLRLGDYMKYYVNYNYKTPEGKLTGYCTYLETDNPYTEKVEKIRKREEQALKEANFPILHAYEDVNIYDFSNFKTE